VGLIRDWLTARYTKYMTISITRGETQGNSNLFDSDVVGGIAHCIGQNIGKLSPQVIRKDASGMVVKDDYLAKLLSLRWSPEITPFDGLYKMASDLVYKSNAIAVIFWNESFTKVQSIVPVTVRNLKIWEDPDFKQIFVRFTWEADNNTYTLPYGSVIHLKARYNKKRFLGSDPELQLSSTMELLDATGKSLKNAVNNSANLKGYLKYNNFADEEELRKKVMDFQKAYMSAGNDGGIAGLDNTMDFHEITQHTNAIPVTQSQFLRENVYRYYNINEKILNSTYNESEWNAFYEAVIEPIALQLSLEFTYKLLTERERGFGNKIIFTANRLQYATLQTRVNLGSQLYDRGIITINEYRELMYYEPIPDGDTRMISLNYVKADDQSQYQIGSNNDNADGKEAKTCFLSALK